MILQKFTQRLRRSNFSWAPIVPLLAVFIGLGTANEAQAQPTYNSDNITISSDPNGTFPQPVVDTYAGQRDDNDMTTPLFEGQDLGKGNSFDLGTGTLMIDAAQADIFTTSTRPITSAQLQYRVFPTGTAVGDLPNYSALALTLPAGAPNFGANTVFSNNTAAINLLTQPQVLGGGNYTVDILYLISYTRAGNNLTLTDPSNSSTYGYRASFSVIAPPITPPGGTTTWISTNPPNDPIPPSKTDWRNAANWTNGVPTRFANAVIPGKSTLTNGVYPILDDKVTPYEVNTLTLQESSNSSRAGLTVLAATLAVYGDLNQPGGGVLASTIGTIGTADPTENSTIILARMGDQVVRGRLVGVDFVIAGSGVKSVVNQMIANNTLNFAPANPAVGVLLQTAVETSTGTSNTLTVNFDTSTNSIIDLSEAGILGTETKVSFIRGVTNATRPLLAGVQNTFGNIGLDITANKSTAATVRVVRIVGDALIGPVGSSATAVKRQFQVTGEVNSNENTDPNFVITSSIVFHYLDSKTGENELNGNNNEANLTLFRTRNNGVPYQPLGGIPDSVNNTVSQSGLTSLNTLTLGDRLNPLPVSMTAFDAVREGRSVLVTWATASEQNNKGYNVQVSTDGKSFETIGFVASKSANSTTPASYRYTDSRIARNGTRYYRLQQVDLDGRTAFYGPRAVTMEGAMTTTLAAYPNPFSNELMLDLTSPAAGPALLRVLDMTGRVVQEQSFEALTGTNNVAVRNAANLKNGIYMVQLVSPLGKTTTLKVVKQ